MVNEDMNQVLNDVKSEVFRDLRVASQAVVVSTHDKQVDVQMLISDVVYGSVVTPPQIKNLSVVGSEMPDVGDVGIILHLDRKNQVTGQFQESGGPAHEIGFGVFLPILK